jgi:gingipain R
MKFLSLVSFAVVFTVSQAIAQSNVQLVQQNGATSVIRFEGDLPQLSYGPNGASVWYNESTSLLKKGLPDLPKVTSALIVDDTHHMEIQVLHAQFEDISGIAVAPSKGNLLRTVDPQTVPSTFGTVYSTNAFFPEAIATLSEAYVQGHYRGQNVQFFPVQYNPVTQTLRIYHHIEVAVVPTAQLGQNPLPSNTPVQCNALQKEVYGNHFLNYSTFANRYEQISELARC